MAMNAQAMCDAIKAEFDDITNSTKWEDGERAATDAYTKAFDKGLTGYVEENMEITYSWSGISPPPASATDPVTSFSSSLVIQNKIIGQPANMAAWAQAIVACFTRATTQHQTSFSDVAPGSLLTTTPLILRPAQGEYPTGLLSICVQILAWLLAATNPAPLVGSHGPFVGATTGMVIR
ncbi:MAG: hypothetical protein FWC97_00385 [Treponema sp.]|nr:hypothetical protein [Treponema sp.]